MTKGLYAGLDLEGSVLEVRDSLNTAYWGKDVRPTGIIVKKDCGNRGADQLQQTLRRAA